MLYTLRLTVCAEKASRLRGKNQMKVRFLATVLVGSTLFFASAARATSVRTGSNYGQPGTSQTAPDVGTEYFVPLTPIDPEFIDLVLQISPTSPYLGDPIQVTVDLSTTSLASDGTTFGLLMCNPGAAPQTAFSNLGTICTPTTNPSCSLDGVADNAGKITLPGSCIVAGETFYFDLASATGVSVVPAPSVTTPEPGSLALLAIALIPFAFISKRRLLA